MNKYLKTFLFLLVFLLSINLNGKDKLEKGFDDLGIYNYFGAKENFEKALKKKTCAAAFGLSKIYINQKNPFYNLDSARVYALKSQNSWSSTKDKEREAILVFGVDSVAIQVQLAAIAEKALSLTMLKNTIDDYAYFIEMYSYSPLLGTAINLRNELIYADVKEINTSQAYKAFMNTYPKAIEYEDAKKRYEKTLFEESASLSSIAEIEAFIENNPTSPYLGQAQDNLYKLYTRSGKLSDYRSFIEKYPLNPNVDASWEKIYKIETAQVSPEVLSDFLMEYPDYPLTERLKEELNNLLKVLVPARLNSKWGFIDWDGNWIIRPIYESCEPFSEGMALISREGKFGFINTRGDEVILASYEDAESFKKGIAVVFDGDFYGAVNRFGDVVIEAKYDDIGELVEGKAYASKNDKYGYIDRNGFVLIPFMYDQAFSFQKGRAITKRGDQFGVIDVDNKWLIPFNFDWIEAHFSDSIVKVRNGKKMGIIDLNLDTILPIDYDQIGKIDQALILVVKDNKVGYINQKGEFIVPMIYESDPFILNWGEFDHGLARIRIKGKMGIIDSTGTRVIPAIFQEIGEFDGVLYPVKKNGKWGYADGNIKLIVNYRYQSAYPYEGKYARVMKNDRWGMLDSLGKEAIPFEYKKLYPSGGVYIMENDSAFGMMDYDLNVILSLEFDQIKYKSLGYFEIELNGKYAYLDIDRRKVFWKELGFSIEKEEKEENEE